MNARHTNHQNLMQADLDRTESTELTGVLCVDLDGTLIASDMLWESLLLATKQCPWILFLLPLWILRGKAFLKRRLAERAVLRPEFLPYREDVVNYLRDQHAAGRTLVLATASDELLAQPIASYLGLFERVLASDGATNLKGSTKAEQLVVEFGDKQFAYAGDSNSDVAVWQHASSAVVIGNSTFVSKVSRLAPLEKVFPVSPFNPLNLVKALRLHHWSKNLLLVLPVFLAHEFEVPVLLKVALGLVLFGLAASSIYVINDLLDLPSDRAHSWKKLRPFASGAVPIPYGLVAFVLLLTGSLLTMWKLLGTVSVLATLVYCILSLTYSFLLKRIVLVDVFVLTSFYSLRLLIGAAMARVPLSNWFLAFSSFFFFSLALAKRYSELVHDEALVHKNNSGRGYQVEDRQLLGTMGVASAFSAIIILSLYTQSSAVARLYPRPSLLMLICPIVLYWTSRVWLRASRGQLQEDPVTMAFRDRVSYLAGLCALLVVTLASVARNPLF